MPTKYQGTAIEREALDVYIKLQRAAETVLARTTSHLAERGLTVSQFAILEALYHLGTLSQRALGQKLLKSAGNMSIVLKIMERRGLISRVRDPQDNRYVRVCITGDGRALIDRIFDRHVAGIVTEVGILTREEQRELGRLCRKLGRREEE